MNVLKRLLPYILLNILVSAATTWAVLNWWNSGRTLLPATQAQPGLEAPANAASLANPTPFSPGATPIPSGVTPIPSGVTPIPPGVKVIEIAEVSGAGSLGAEGVAIRRLGDGELSMSGWRLDDNAGHRFTFPDMALFKGGSIRIFTRAGSNSVNELYWGLKEPVWISGKTASLYDSQGVLRASFAIP
jgi:hypothetical protein